MKYPESADETFRRMADEWERSPGLSVDEAVASVGPAWQPLAAVAWAVVRSGGGRVKQVKEKFGALRVYCDHLDPAREDEVRSQLRALERRSIETCEWCGAPGELRDAAYAAALPVDELLRRNWWYKAFCAEHAWRFYVEDDRWWLGPEWRGDSP